MENTSASLTSSLWVESTYRKFSINICEMDNAIIQFQFQIWKAYVIILVSSILKSFWLNGL